MCGENLVHDLSCMICRSQNQQAKLSTVCGCLWRPVPVFGCLWLTAADCGCIQGGALGVCGCMKLSVAAPGYRAAVFDCLLLSVASCVCMCMYAVPVRAKKTPAILDSQVKHMFEK